MSYLSEKILSVAQSMPEGGFLFAKEFLHLASRAAIDQTFSRLARNGKLVRIERGIYAAPVVSKFGTRPPSVQAIMQEIEATSGEMIVSNGASDANALGLSTQVPTREVFLTSGRSRTLQLGKRSITLKKGRKCQLVLGKSTAGQAIRALTWLGPEQATTALEILKKKLPATEWETIRSVRKTLPGWMARAVSEMSEN